MIRHLFLALSLLFLLPVVLLGTSYIMVSDELLVEQADAIVLAQVTGVSTRTRGGYPETVYSFRIERALKGAPDSTIDVRVPGGEHGGVRWDVAGMPAFEVGQRSLLFLKDTGRGDFSPLHLMLGAFHDVSGGRGRLAVRNLSEAREFQFKAGGQLDRYHRPRDLDRFVSWIERRAAGVEADENYFAVLDQNDVEQGLAPFTLLNGPFPEPSRWFIFDESQSEDWRINENGQPGFDSEGADAPGTQAFKDALNAWNNDPNSTIDYNFAGTSDLNDPDNLNAFSLIVFDDPTDQISTDFACFGNGFGGTLGVGGPLVSGQNLQFKGQTFHPTLVASVIMNMGVDCLRTQNIFSQSVYETNIAEVYTHELGHTLSIGHSCGDGFSPACNTSATLNNATMNAQAAFDGRGASIMQDDRDAIAFLYGASAGGPGDSTSFFPQVGDVLIPDAVGLQTTLLIDNATNQAVTATLDFFGAGTLTGGNVASVGPLVFPIEGLPNASSYTLNLAAGEVRSLESPGDSPFLVGGSPDFPLGFARLTAPEGVTGTAVFIRTNELGIVATKAGVPASETGTDATLIVENRDSNRVGFAIVNPPSGAGLTAQATANVTLKLYDRNFNPLATTVISLAAGAHLSRFIDEIFPLIDVSNLLGSLTIESDSPIAGLQLLDDDPDGRFPQNVAILTAFPTVNGRADATLVAGSASLIGRNLSTRVNVGQSSEGVATVYRIYDGDTLLARIVRGGGSGELRESFRLPDFVTGANLRVSVRLLYDDKKPSREYFLEY